MIKLFKKHWSKILLVQFIAIALICVFTSKTYAYTLDNENNLVSQNLLDTNVSINIGGGNGNLSRNNNTLSITMTPSDFYVFTPNFFELEQGTYTFSLSSYSHIANFVIMNSSGWITSSPTTHTLTFNANTQIGFRIDWNESYTGQDTISIMINEGTTALAYEPFGTWYNQQDYNQLQEVANGVQYGTLQYLDYMEFKDSVTQEPIEKDGLTEFSLDYLKEHNAVSNSGSLAVNYFINSTTNPNEHPYTIVMYFNTQVSINMLSMMFTSYAQGTIEVFGNSSTIINFSDSNQLIDYQDFNGSNINYITELYINFGNADAISNISFNSFASQSYQYGFDYGQTIGDQKGYDRGYEQGNADGYQRGYNEGVEQDFENGGMKVLFNSILSYPVNLIRSVFDFEFMGINIASLVMFIVSIGIVAFVITKFL